MDAIFVSVLSSMPNFYVSLTRYKELFLLPIKWIFTRGGRGRSMKEGGNLLVYYKPEDGIEEGVDVVVDEEITTLENDHLQTITRTSFLRFKPVDDDQDLIDEQLNSDEEEPPISSLTLRIDDEDDDEYDTDKEFGDSNCDDATLLSVRL